MSQQQTRKRTLLLAIWTALWVLSTALVTYVSTQHQTDYTTLKAGFLALNLAIGIIMIEMNRRYVLALDELQQKIHLQAMGISLGVTLIGGIAYSLADVGNLIQGDAEIGYLIMLMGISYLISVVTGARKYA
ncbi:hypothetical protein IDAT_09785 [Pseudidiomarina atlantica]|uniref:Uncharacterized protein n=1 Tax=Pseudidiomarina atlantica TaxID=1517416 RepID=A0A094J6S0_9GAMM|nr:hypothetical protein [Pseudidiomarina atlantica]KFZ28286.1 hypothetical protein IDAT_09785 [Pseudidiomarina atlantica]